MNRADILRMAREAGAIKHEHHEWWNFMEGELERFAELVEQRAAKAEREACAKLCLEKHANGNWKYDTRDECHDAIRARSKT